MNPKATKRPYAHCSRALTRGLLFSAFLTACGSSGGGSAASGGTPPVSSPTAQTQSLTLYHGFGFVCAVSSDKSKLLCWASQEESITNGNAGLVGLTSIVPAVVATNSPGTICGAQLNDSAIGYFTCGSQYYIYVTGNGSSGTANVWQETITCTVTAPDSYNCPGEAVPDITLSWHDVRVRHWPHSHEYYEVRKTA